MPIQHRFHDDAKFQALHAHHDTAVAGPSRMPMWFSRCWGRSFSPPHAAACQCPARAHRRSCSSWRRTPPSRCWAWVRRLCIDNVVGAWYSLPTSSKYGRSPLNNSQFSWTGKVVATSILSSSSLALTGGIGIMRLCLGELAFRTRLQALCMPAASKHRLIRRVAEG